MILVDIHVPAMDKTYDFELDEEMTAGEVTKRIVKLVAQKEDTELCENEKMFLYSLEKEGILSETITLSTQGITNGEKLILI